MPVFFLFGPIPLPSIQVGKCSDRCTWQFSSCSDQVFDGVEEEIIGMNVPTGMPLVYDLDENLKPLNRQYLGDPEAVAKAMEAVANQGKAK